MYKKETELNHQLDYEIDANKQLKAENEKHTRALRKMEEVLDDLVEELKTTKSSLKKKSQKLADMEFEVERARTASNEINRQKELTDNLTQEVLRHKSLTDNLNQELNFVKNQNQNQTATIDKLNQELHQAQDDAKALVRAVERQKATNRQQARRIAGILVQQAEQLAEG
jgi:predicted  nucleic acid-binding Zn-ribbon protein